MRKSLLLASMFFVSIMPVNALPFHHSKEAPITNSRPVLERGTPVILQTVNSFNSGTSSVGTKIRFRVAKDVKAIDGSIAIAKLTETSGFITAVQPAQGIHGGSVTIHIDSIKAVDGQTVPLNFDWIEIGHDGAGGGEQIAGALATGIYRSAKGAEAYPGMWFGKVPGESKNAATQADVLVEPQSLAVRGDVR